MNATTLSRACGVAVPLLALAALAGRAADAERDRLARGRELFSREWLPGDRRSHAGRGGAR